MEKLIITHSALTSLYKTFRRKGSSIEISVKMQQNIFAHSKKIYNPIAEEEEEKEEKEGLNVEANSVRNTADEDLDQTVLMEAQTNAEPITPEEINGALNFGRSASKGIDGFNQTYLKAIAGSLSPILKVIFNNSFTFGCFPRSFLRNRDIFIHKGGDVEDANNYRSIVLQNPVPKVYTKILQSRMIR